MRLATYRPAVKSNAPSLSGTSNATGYAAWVEPNGDLVDISSAYCWSCQSGGREVDPHIARHLTSVAGLLNAGLLEDGGFWLDDVRRQWILGRDRGDEAAHGCIQPAEEVQIDMPIRPRSFRDFYAFEQHVKTCRARRGQDMVKEWYEFPAFYFSNPDAFLGPDEPVWAPKGCEELDFELEIACVIGKTANSVPASQADHYIAGYAVLNDWSARDIQRAEVKVGLGPAKGKDFATSLGPYLVTPSDLSVCAESSANGRRYDLAMTARVNGKLVSKGNFQDIHYTFAQMIERASSDVALYPGDVIGSGTVGSGCILELGTEVLPWLQPGDLVELDIEGLGCLRTPVVDRPY